MENIWFEIGKWLFYLLIVFLIWKIFFKKKKDKK